MYLFGIEFSSFLNTCPGVGLWDHLLLTLVSGTPMLVSVVAALTLVPTSSVPGSLFSAASPAFAVCRLFDGGCCGCCELIARCGFDLRFPGVY